MPTYNMLLLIIITSWYKQRMDLDFTAGQSHTTTSQCIVGLLAESTCHVHYFFSSGVETFSLLYSGQVYTLNIQTPLKNDKHTT